MPDAGDRMTMLSEYSKPTEDVAEDTARLLTANDELRSRQRAIAAALAGMPVRRQCLLCAAPLASAQSFGHRGIPYVFCDTCRHLQCAVVPPPGYPAGQQDFAAIYPPLDAAQYRDRTARIYRPKLEWARRAAAALGLGDLLARSWVEIGSGAGNFVAALREAGAARVVGLEAEERLVGRATAALSAPLVQRFEDSLAEAVERHPADIYVAWFVLEHCIEIPRFLTALRRRPPGTVFLFSVPMVGLGTLLESAFDGHYARSLDSVVHLQLFTERSVAYALDQAGYEAVAEWVFGQDADDLYRCLAAQLGARDPGDAFGPEVARLVGALSGIQQALDRARLADARHILAVRR
jgi:methyltransferase family protein